MREKVRSGSCFACLDSSKSEKTQLPVRTAGLADASLAAMSHATLILLLALAPAADPQPPVAISPPSLIPTPVEPGGPVAYQAIDYARFAPRTALDMVRQTPGFVLVESSERRGFSGAVGNVLVDGTRPVAKSQSLSDILQRIPAAQVVRIELLRGAEAAGDSSGHAVIANVVRTPSAGQGVWSLGTEIAQQRVPAPNGWASWTGRNGVTDYGIGANGYSLRRELPGSRETVSGTGELLATRTEHSPRSFHEMAVNGEVGRPMLGGRTQLTGQAHHSRYHQANEALSASPAGDPTERELAPYTETRRTLEAGVEHDRRLGPWELSVAALMTRKRFRSDIRLTRESLGGEMRSVFTQDIERDSGESIARVTAARRMSPRHRLEAGVEAAVNTLEQALVRTFDFGTGPFPVPVLNGNLTVRENRSEAHIAHNWQPAELWTIETRLAGEASRLSFSGDSEQSVSLSYLKPSIQVNRALGGQNQLRARLHREVSQLDFEDFVSVASLSDDIIDGGNPDLRPEQSWRAEIALDLRFGNQGALSLALFERRLSNTIDLVPIGPPGAVIDAPGNIGPGRVDGVQASLRLPLQPMLAGGTLTLDGIWMDARVTDPLTGERRTISDFAETKFEIELRQDLTARKLAWGAKFTDKPEYIHYRFDEVERRRESRSLDLWMETTAMPGLRARITLVKAIGAPERRERTFFSPDRNGLIDRTERNEYRPGQWINLSVSGSF
jgi:hypothetical protein